MVDPDIQKEIDVLNSELNSILKEEMPSVFKSISEYIEHIMRYLTKSDGLAGIQDPNKMLRQERLVLLPINGMEGLKCSLNMAANELKNIEINFKQSIRHNNYIYKSNNEAAWNLYQISNCSNILKAVQSYFENIRFNSLEQAIFNVDHVIDNLNSARNILLFPKKRQITELQNQKNMKIFPLVPNDLVFSFYIQGYKLLLAIYVVKGNETNKHVLECGSVSWLNNVMILMTSCLQRLQQVRDKLSVFEQIEQTKEPG